MAIVMTAALTFAFYLLLSGSVGAEQLVAAAVVSAIAVGWSALLRHKGGPRQFTFTMAHIAPWLRAIAKVPADTVRVGVRVVQAAAMGGSPGRAAHPDFRFGETNDPVENARRATALMAGSLTPDTFVVDAPPGQSTALCHKIAATPPPGNAEWLA